MKHPDWTKPKLTYGETCGMAMMVQNREEAEAYLRAYARWLLTVATGDRPADEAEAIAVAKHNIGYYTGYIDPMQAGRVMELFNTAHPIFGKKWPSPEEAFQMGQDGKRPAPIVADRPTLPNEINPGRRIVE